LAIPVPWSFWHYETMQTTLLMQFLLCPLVFLSLLWITAPYGRHYKPGWGPSLPNRLAWVLMELPAVLVISWLVLSAPNGTNAYALVPLSFWLFHYLYRTFVFPLLMHPSDKTFPAMLVIFAIAFNFLNGYNNSLAILENSIGHAPWSKSHFWIGSIVFVIGFIMHSHSDLVIRKLRKPGETQYSIPRGGMFRWVSSPHYLGEIIQWTGWAILTWSLAGLAFALFTFCNLAPRAISNQKWYYQRFPDYPVNRKTLIPGIF
jgi:protein-S-isoprenylcysteine O-methyltransferase Ste14